MIVRGPKLAFRRVRDDDAAAVFQAMRGWKDKHGYFTEERALARVSMAMMESDLAYMPLDDDAEFLDNYMIEHVPTGQAIGHTQVRAWGKSIWVNFISLRPESRGQGYFAEIYWLYTFLIFEMFQADHLWHEDFTDVVALEKMRDRLGGEYLDDERRERDRVDPRESTKWKWTREAFEAYPEKYVVDGKLLSIYAP